MIYPGTDLKYRVTIAREGFSADKDDFDVRVFTNYRQVAFISKEDMYTDDSGRWYFSLSDVQAGVHYAELRARVEDSDYEDGSQQLVDRQQLCTVGGCGCGGHAPCACDYTPDSGMTVTYERVFTVNLNGIIYLLDATGEYILDSTGERIILKKQ